MARSRAKKHFTLPLAVLAGFAVPTARTYDAVKTSGWRDGVGELVRGFTGYQPWVGGWDVKHLQYGLLPVGLGMLVHKLASALGVNRMLANAGIPVVRI